MSKIIPIVILTKDEPKFLELMIKSIVNRTKYPYKIFIVDNNSQDVNQKNLLVKLEQEYKLEVIYNDKNHWVLGFNNAIEIIDNKQEFNHKYIVLSDGDIIVPLPKDGVCWLEYLVKKMQKNITIGKIGLSLDISLIAKTKKFNKIYNLEKKYMKGPKVDELIMAPVDTTLAIYRRDLYIMNKFKIIPGHASLVKPYYYIFRTSKVYQAKHLGWRKYDNPTIKQLEEKIVCFTKYAAYVDPMVLDKVSLKTKYFFKIGRYFFKTYWAFKVVYYWTTYIIKHFPRDLNEIQSKYR